MNYKNRAERLIDARTERERKSLLAGLGADGDATLLARALRDTYYASWTNEPKRVERAARALKSLEKLDDGDEIKALSIWVSGIADLTRGRLDSAAANLERAAEIFRAINREHDAAQTQVAKLYALALLGRYKEALACGESALVVFKRYGNELARGKVEKNLGNIVARWEDNRRAEKYYLSARGRFLKIGDEKELTMSENSLANTYAELNDFRRAERFYALALARAQAAKMFVTEAEIEASLGNLALFRGRYGEALRFLELSRRKYDELKMPHQTAIAALEIADVYLELNLAKEAFAIYESIAGDLRRFKLQGEEARARANFGRAAASLRENKRAKSEFKKAARLYTAERNAVGAAFVKLSEAGLELATGTYKAALMLAVEAEKLLASGDNARHLLSARYVRGAALLKLNRAREAVKILEKTRAEAVRSEQKNIALACLNSLGEAALQAKDSAAAKSYFRRAVALVENLRQPVAAEEFRMAFLAGKLAPFENLAKIYLAENDWRRAFAAIEKARSRSLSETVGAAQAVNVKGHKKVSAKLEARLKLLREELNWFYSRLNRSEETAEIARLQREAKRREREIADVMRQIESTLSANDDAFAKRGASVDKTEFKQLQNLLGARKALVEFVRFDGVFAAFVITEKRIKYVSNLATESEILDLLDGLQFQFGALRYGAAPLKIFMPELKRRADVYLRRLHEKLFAPLADLVKERDLIVVPSGALNYVPFAALFDGENYLIERREIVFAPSAGVWRVLAAKPSRKPKNALLMGVADERIPLVEREIETLGQIFPDAKSFTGAAATFAAYAENAPAFDIIHLACHAQFRADNPLFSSLHLADGSVTARDVLKQNLRAELVTLSACETGLNEIAAGEEILGLTRGFLSAGASSLLLSLWTIADDAAAHLMKDFYENLQRGETVAASLKAAQINFIEQGSHPYFWSPFVAVGR